MKEIIKKWYETLSFPKEFDNEFYKALESFENTEISLEDFEPKSGIDDLMHFLYFCEGLEEKYKLMGIDEPVLFATLRDIVNWTKVWSEIKGELYLGETYWLRNHMEMKIFTLGRLQFCFGKAERDILEYNIAKGDDILEIHIPDGDRLDENECRKSLSMAKDFFAKYFPQYNYKRFTCHSWLLASELKDIINEESNIIKFQKMFDIISEEESFDMLKYLFRHDATKENLHLFSANTSLGEKIKKRVESGKTLHVAYGIVK